MSDGTPDLLSISQLVAGYGGADVLHAIDLTVGRGEFVCVIGPSGLR